MDFAYDSDKCPDCGLRLNVPFPGGFICCVSDLVNHIVLEGKLTQAQKAEKDGEIDKFLRVVNALLAEGGGVICFHMSKPQLLGKFDEQMDEKLLKLLADNTFYHENFERYFFDMTHVVLRIKPQARLHSTLAFNTKVSLNKGVEDPNQNQMQVLIENTSVAKKQFNRSHLEDRKEQVSTNQQAQRDQLKISSSFTASAQSSTPQQCRSEEESAVKHSQATRTSSESKSGTTGERAGKRLTSTEKDAPPKPVGAETTGSKSPLASEQSKITKSEAQSASLKRKLSSPAEQPSTSKDYTLSESPAKKRLKDPVTLKNPKTSLSTMKKCEMRSANSSAPRKPARFTYNADITIETGIFQESLSIQAKGVDGKILTEQDRKTQIKKLIEYCWEKSYLYISAFTKVASGGSIFFGLSEDKNSKRERTGKYKCEGLVLNRDERAKLKTDMLNKVKKQMLWLACSDIVDPVRVIFHPVANSEADRCVVEVEVKNLHGVSFYHADGPQSYRLVTKNGQTTVKPVKVTKWVEILFRQRKKRLDAAKAELEKEQTQQEEARGEPQDDARKQGLEIKTPSFSDIYNQV